MHSLHSLNDRSQYFIVLHRHCSGLFVLSDNKIWNVFKNVEGTFQPSDQTCHIKLRWLLIRFPPYFWKIHILNFNLYLTFTWPNTFKKSFKMFLWLLRGTNMFSVERKKSSPPATKQQKQLPHTHTHTHLTHLYSNTLFREACQNKPVRTCGDTRRKKGYGAKEKGKSTSSVSCSEWIPAMCTRLRLDGFPKSEALSVS